MIRLSARTIVTNLVYKTIDVWKAKLPDQSLDSYDNWKDDVVDTICSLLEKHKINVSEALILDDSNKEQQKSEDD